MYEIQWSFLKFFFKDFHCNYHDVNNDDCSATENIENIFYGVKTDKTERCFLKVGLSPSKKISFCLFQ